MFSSPKSTKSNPFRDYSLFDPNSPSFLDPQNEQEGYIYGNLIKFTQERAVDGQKKALAGQLIDFLRETRNPKILAGAPDEKYKEFSEFAYNSLSPTARKALEEAGLYSERISAIQSGRKEVIEKLMKLLNDIGYQSRFKDAWLVAEKEKMGTERGLPLANEVSFPDRVIDYDLFNPADSGFLDPKSPEEAMMFHDFDRFSSENGFATALDFLLIARNPSLIARDAETFRTFWTEQVESRPFLDGRLLRLYKKYRDLIDKSYITRLQLVQESRSTAIESMSTVLELYKTSRFTEALARAKEGFPVVVPSGDPPSPENEASEDILLGGDDAALDNAAEGLDQPAINRGSDGVLGVSISASGQPGPDGSDDLDDLEGDSEKPEEEDISYDSTIEVEPI